MVSQLQWIVGHDCEVRTPNIYIPHSNNSTYDKTNIAYLICCFIFTQHKRIYFY
jgi:hypothetical protein